VFTRELVMGDVLAEGDVLAGVNGRPVLLMVGKTPAFRDMLPGSSGVDVRQLQAGLKRLGFSSSTSGVLDKATQAGLRSWYQSKGFQAKEPTTEEASALRAAREGVASARSTVAAAERALTEARKGASESEVLQAELSVDSAKQAYLEAAAGEKAAAAKQLKIAKLALAEVKKKPVIDAEKAAVSDAKAALKRAKEEVSELETATGVSVPFCEVVFVPSLPATVVENPQTNPDGESQDAGGVWATLATGKLSLQATLDPTDAALVKEGAKVLFREDSAGEDQEGRVEKIVDADAGPTLVVATDGGFSEEQRGASMRVSVELESTAGAVLVVPTVALSGQADGRAVVEKLVDGQPSQVRVKAGLVADGYVEVQVLEGQLEAGDEVVTGR
jgi:peptidoglycan hydrolase-like protein with peptidoglycan-binding domain